MIGWNVLYCLFLFQFPTYNTGNLHQPWPYRPAHTRQPFGNSSNSPHHQSTGAQTPWRTRQSRSAPWWRWRAAPCARPGLPSSAGSTSSLATSNWMSLHRYLLVSAVHLRKSTLGKLVTLQNLQFYVRVHLSRVRVYKLLTYLQSTISVRLQI